MLNTSHGFVPWDDSHHAQPAITDGRADGRWLFINGNNTPRIARLDLTRFETDEIIEIPNHSGGHGPPRTPPCPGARPTRPSNSPPRPGDTARRTSPKTPATP